MYRQSGQPFVTATAHGNDRRRFPFGGFEITHNAKVEGPIPGLYAAREIVGGLVFHNYASGTGLMSGAVFGRLAGRNAARSCKA